MSRAQGGPRPISSSSTFASFAENVSPVVRERIRDAEAAGIRGRADLGFMTLRDTLVSLSPDADDDRVALGEMVALLTRWGAPRSPSWRLLDGVVDACRSPRARGAVLLARARTAEGRTGTAYCTRALSEFTVAEDIRGQAVTLGRMSFPTDDGLSGPYRRNLGKRGFALAKRTGEPWTMALCAGMLAACETYLGHRNALSRWKQAASLLPADLDTLTGEIASLNCMNWALTCAGFGDYDKALEVVARGRLGGRGPWVHAFAAVEGLVRQRTGDLCGAREAATVALQGPPDRRVLGAAVLAAVSLETARRLPFDDLQATVDHVNAHSRQWGASVAATQAHVRQARREPRPARGLGELLRTARELGHRFGWEDALLALAEISAPAAREEAVLMADLWPPYPRGVAIRSVIEGHLAGGRGWRQLVDGADTLAAIGEPVTAGRAYHAAAKVAPSSADQARTRERAVELLRAAGADRSLAALVRDRSLQRGPSGVVPVPDSQRHQVNPGLTPREHQVALLAAQGHTAVEIAEGLGISVGTARNHLMNVRQKFGSVPKRRLGVLLGAVHGGE